MLIKKLIGRIRALFIVSLIIAFSGCGGSSNNKSKESTEPPTTNRGVCVQNISGINWPALLEKRCELLSDYGLFTGLPNNPNESLGLYYELSNELFIDHARKYRYIYLPPNTTLNANQEGHLDFPIGSILVKVIALPTTSTSSAEERIAEVRLMVLRDNGWIFIPYVWDETLKDARLNPSGSLIPASFFANEKQLNFIYESPSQNRCEQCHQNRTEGTLTFVPIGPKVRLLNRSIEIESQTVNQLEHWQTQGIIDLPKDVTDLPATPSWRDETFSLQQRAKAYLDINCAYCHTDHGAAALSGLRLEYSRTLGYNHGVCNSSHGWRGGGYDIWPGRGDISSIPLRMELDEATDRMPPIGRVVADEEAILLIRQWIDSMPLRNCSSG